MNQEPSLELFFNTVNAYQRTAALKAAIELKLFTFIGNQSRTAEEISKDSGASAKGIRVLCDVLTVIGFLKKDGKQYSLTPDSLFFLDQNSPAYWGGTIEFLLSPMLMEGFQDLTETVRNGGTTLKKGGTMAPEHPVWVKFARAMVPMAGMAGGMIAEQLKAEGVGIRKVLDIAAGHGLYGISIARVNPEAEVFAVDWPQVLDLATEHANGAGVGARFHALPGSAFDVDLGEGYDLVLITNFLHHFNAQTCESFLRRIHAALKPGGRAITLEFVPNEDRISPPAPALFSLMMLASTDGGDAYTFREFDQIFRNAGFQRNEERVLIPGFQTAIHSFR